MYYQYQLSVSQYHCNWWKSIFIVLPDCILYTTSTPSSEMHYSILSPENPYKATSESILNFIGYRLSTPFYLRIFSESLSLRRCFLPPVSKSILNSTTNKTRIVSSEIMIKCYLFHTDEPPDLTVFVTR